MRQAGGFVVNLSVLDGWLPHMDIATVTFCLLLGAALGAAAVWVSAIPALRERLAGARAESDLLRDRITDLEGASSQDRELAATLSPLAGALGRLEQQVHVLERDRVQQYSRLGEQLEAMRISGEALREHTSALAGALRSPTARGSWGEVQLRRVVEHAGMLNRVDFTEQSHATGPDGASVRPDLVVHLPGGKHVVVDAKAPMAAFLRAGEILASGMEGAADQSRHEEQNRLHAKAVRAHVDTLAAKEYWRAFDPSPELVVCFVPGEAFLAAACAADPTLLEYAMARRVVLATPTTLLALLRTVALTWQSEAVTGNAKQVFDLGRDLYARLATLGGRTTQLGRTLERAVEDYNAMVATLERRVLVTARRLNDLDLTDDPLPQVSAVTPNRRPLAAPELMDDAPAYTQ